MDLDNLSECAGCGLRASAGAHKACPICGAEMIPTGPMTPAGPMPGDETETVTLRDAKTEPENLATPELDLTGGGMHPSMAGTDASEAEIMSHRATVAAKAAADEAAAVAELLPGDEAAPNGEGITIGPADVTGDALGGNPVADAETMRVMNEEATAEVIAEEARAEVSAEDRRDEAAPWGAADRDDN